MKRTLLLSALCVLLALPATAQYPYGPGRPRVETVTRHGNEYIGWHRYYFGLRAGLAVSTVNSEAPLLDGNDAKTGLNLGVLGGVQLTRHTPLFLESGLFYTQKGGKSGDSDSRFTYDLNYLRVPLLLKYKYFAGHDVTIQPFAGGYLACGVGGNIKNYGARDSFSSFDDGYFNRFDGGLAIGCGVGFNMLQIEAAYEFGLANVGQDDFYDTHNGCFLLNVGVNF